MDGRSIPREPDVPEPERHVERFGGDGRVHKTSAFVSDSQRLSGIPNSVRRDHHKLQRTLHPVNSLDPEDWMANAQRDRARETDTVVFPPPRMDSGPGLDQLGRPRRRRRVN